MCIEPTVVLVFSNGITRTKINHVFCVISSIKFLALELTSTFCSIYMKTCQNQRYLFALQPLFWFVIVVVS